MSKFNQYVPHNVSFLYNLHKKRVFLCVSVSFPSTHIWMGQEDLQGFVLAKDAMRRNLPQEGLQGSTVDLPLSQTQETCRDATRRTHSVHTVQGFGQQRMILTQLFQKLRRHSHLSLRGEGGELAKRKKQQHRFYYSLATSAELFP